MQCNEKGKRNEIEKRNKKIELITIPYLMMMYYVCEFKILTLNTMFMDMMLNVLTSFGFSNYAISKIIIIIKSEE